MKIGFMACFPVSIACCFEATCRSCPAGPWPSSLYRLKINFGSLKPFLLENSERVKSHAEAVAKEYGRPFRYLQTNIDKEKRSEEHTSELQSHSDLVCRLLLEKK